MKIDLTVKQRKIILSLLNSYLPSTKVWAFGSRVKFTSKPESDLDLTAFITPEQKTNLSSLKEAFDDSDLPFRVDVHDWYSIPDKFKKNIEKQYVVLQDMKSDQKQLPKGWKTYKLGDHIEVRHGFAFQGKYFSDKPTKNILLTPGNFEIGGGFKTDKFKYYEGEVPKDYILKEGDIIISMTDLSKAGDTLGYSAKIPAHAGVRFLHNQRLGLVKFKNDELDKDFVYWILRTRQYQGFIVGSATGSSVKHTSPSRICAYEFIAPSSKKIQKAIASILSALDDKIETNLQTNKTLEEMVQAIFKEWFVKFNFPGFDGKFVNGLPKGWKIGKLGDSFNLIMGQSPPGESYNETGEGDVFYQGRTDFGFRFPSNRMYTTNPSRKAKRYDTLISVRAPVGDINMAMEDCCIGRGLSAIKHKTGAYSFTYYSMKNLESTFRVFEGEGTVFGSISKTNFENIEVIEPDEKNIQKFEIIANGIDTKILNNTLEIQTLIQLRDNLLPRLMSGKIEVKA
jgi:type I restriction enzyme S subunit